MRKIKVGVVGLGFMGQMHFGCYRRNPGAEIVAVCDENQSKLSGEAKVEGNIAGAAPLDLSGVRATANLEELLADPDIELLDFCLPTPAHAEATIAALEAGKHVLCEKPMARTLEECDAMMTAQQKSGKSVLVGHCLRFWPHYVAAQKMIAGGELGQISHARFFRAGGAPKWSGWLMDGAQSGGAVLDMHIHDVDTALWWFGPPDSVQSGGVVENGLPLKVDANWHYSNGPHVQIHGGWDLNRSDFAMGFEVTGQNGTLTWDSSRGEALQLHRGGEMREIAVEAGDAYQNEINYFLDCLQNDRAPQRVTLQSSRLSVEWTLRELEQLGFSK